MQQSEPRWVDVALSRVLRGGVLLSTTIVALGVLLTFVHHPSYVRSEVALRQLTAPEQAFPRTVRGVLGGAEQARGQALITLGLLLLIATPVARVALSIGIFTIERDRLYTSLTTLVLVLLLLSFVVGAANAQEMPMPMPMTTPMPMPGMQMSMPMNHDAVAELLMRQASGTGMNPAAAPMQMSMTQYGNWMLMLHAQAFISDVQQSGPRGADKFFSTNWAMGMADRKLGDGHLMLRSMLSLEPLTVGKKYPELFQTGETIDGRPIFDAQHPHDFFMELAAEYARPLTAGTIGYVYAAPVGDPALGPVAYPHRASAAEIPQATQSHHFQDSTHIAGSVITLGAQSGMFGYAFSGFHGREPDENRWDIDTGRIDSWSTRVTFDPSPHWTAQLSTGHLHHPEALDPHDVQRTTASVAYSNAFSSTSLIYGHSEKNSWTAESVLHFGMNHLTGRGEVVDKDFRIKALTLGYTRDVVHGAGIGTNVTVYSIPDSAKTSYGSSPRSVYVFVRLRAGA